MYAIDMLGKFQHNYSKFSVLGQWMSLESMSEEVVI